MRREIRFAVQDSRLPYLESRLPYLESRLPYHVSLHDSNFYMGRMASARLPNDYSSTGSVWDQLRKCSPVITSLVTVVTCFSAWPVHRIPY
jgi:hypothetical protein